MASWAGVRLCSFSPEGAGFPCAGPGEEVINDRGARRGECSGLMLVLIRSWSPATDRIQPGPCVCVCVCWEVGGNGGPGTPGSSHQPPSLPIVPPPPLLLFCWKSLLLSVLHPPADGGPGSLLKSKSTPGCGGRAGPRPHPSTSPYCGQACTLGDSRGCQPC